MEIKKDEVWKVRSRGFSGIFKLLENIDTEKDSFFNAEIVDGVKSYLNRESKYKGDVVSFRTSLTDFLEKVVEQENKKCCLCKEDYGKYGNNALPVMEGSCCNKCNDTKVIPARIKEVVK